MPMLHTVNKSPFEKRSLSSCLAHALDDAAILLIEDGVYGALAGAGSAAPLADAIGRVQVFALGPDLAARGLDAARLLPGIEVVDYTGFVALAARYDKVAAWL